ncbi:MAG: SDR family oxidoreductase [Thermoanaerobacteraceae bacterium]|nr:SDR family oxidoreductase [Thermoanaerobacteraceae bacterium]
MKVQDLFNLQGRVAVVTGGSMGLGEQACVALAEAGASVVVAARKVERCESTAERLRSLGVKAVAVKCDVSNPADVDTLVESALREFGRIDILVNSAGITWGAPAEDYPLERWQKVLEVNVTGTFLCSQKVGRVMIGQRYGKIINLASIASFRGADPEAMDALAYQTSKGAVAMMTRDLAAKWARHGINVNAIAPGWFPTHMSGSFLKVKGEILLNHIPLRRFGGEEELKGAVVFLASQASSYVTGHILVVDGGYLCV